MQRRKERGSDGPVDKNDNTRGRSLEQPPGRRGELPQDESQESDEDRMKDTGEEFGGNRRERRRDRHE
jgi:hypothetical protein